MSTMILFQSYLRLKVIENKSQLELARPLKISIMLMMNSKKHILTYQPKRKQVKRLSVEVLM